MEFKKPLIDSVAIDVLISFVITLFLVNVS